MRVFVYPADKGGCGSYRMRWPAAALQAQGADVVIDPDPIMAAYNAGGEVVAVAKPDCDVVVFQRPTNRRRVDGIRFLQRQGIAVVVEVDDDFQTCDPRNVAAAAFHPKTNPEANWHHLARACQVADMVIVSTPALAERYGRHGRVAVLPNYVPRRYLGVEADRDSTVVIGWTGTPLTHPGDLDVVGDAVQRATDATVSFRAIGSRMTLDVLGVRGGDYLEWCDLHTGSYQREVARLDVGIVPLRDTAFNHAKSWIKGLEYAALGVPFVASPVTEYRSLHALGIGVLADRPRSWLRELRALTQSADLRADLAGRGRETVQALTIEGHAELWWLAWMEARAQHIARAA